MVGCSNSPACKYIKKEPAQTFGTCPQCKQGSIVTKRSRRGIFYACDRYPDCKTAFWAKPVIPEGKTEAERCPDCGSLLLYGPKETIKCSSKECKYQRPV